MAGNSQRRGATRKPGSKKGANVGTGGHSRQGLEGKGPTPKATERPHHPAGKKKIEQDRQGSAGPRRSGAPHGSGAPRTSGTGTRGPANRGRRTGSGRSTTHEMVAGRNSVLEALRADIPVTTVYLASRLESDDRTKEIVQIALDRHLNLLEVTKPELDRLTDGAVHQGVALQVPPYEYADIDDLLDAAEISGRPALIVALDSITDPRNLGAVLRSAAAFGAHGVLVPERRAASMTASAWKVSAGAAARIPVARVTNLVRALEKLHQAGCYVVGLDAGGDTEIGELPFATDALVLVVGSEGKGLSRLVGETCDSIASIHIDSETESLNAGVAAGISLYEVARTRRLAGI